MGGHALNGKTQRYSSSTSLIYGGRGEVLYKNLTVLSLLGVNVLDVMSKRIRYKVLGQGKPCPKCKNPMENRTHKEIDQRVLFQPFYFTEWDYCRNCNHVQHYEHFKRWNNTDKSTYMQSKEVEDEQLSFLSQI